MIVLQRGICGEGREVQSDQGESAGLKDAFNLAKGPGASLELSVRSTSPAPCEIAKSGFSGSVSVCRRLRRDHYQSSLLPSHCRALGLRLIPSVPPSELAILSLKRRP